MANYQFGLMPAATKDIVVLFSTLYLLVFLFVSTQSVKKYSDLKIEKEAALKRMAETELKFLKTQMNPHFLFNTLNNLYSLTVKKSKHAPEAILKLSNLLDYVLSVSESPLVSLKQELAVLEDFTYLESLRFGDRLHLKKDISIKNMAALKLPPLCLVTLVENCFKHGGDQHQQKLIIALEIKNEHGKLQIRVSNNHNPSFSGKIKGIGLLNLQKQLNHLYSDKFTFSTTQINNNFIAHLTLHN